MPDFVCLETAFGGRLSVWSMAEVNRKVIIHALEQSQVRGGERGKQLTLRVLREKLSVASKAPSKPACSCVQSSPVPFLLVQNCRTRDPRGALLTSAALSLLSVGPLVGAVWCMGG